MLAQFSPSTLLLFSINKFIVIPFRCYCQVFQSLENNTININQKKTPNQSALLTQANIYLSDTWDAQLIAQIFFLLLFPFLWAVTKCSRWLNLLYHLRAREKVLTLPLLMEHCMWPRGLQQEPSQVRAPLLYTIFFIPSGMILLSLPLSLQTLVSW